MRSSAQHRVTWLATRGTAKEMRRELYPLPTSVLKVRIKKNQVENPIEPKYLREVKRFRIPRKKR